MTPLFKKLNFRQFEESCILQHPLEFEQELNDMRPFTTIRTDLNECDTLEFVLVFVKTKAEIDRFAPAVLNKLKGDGIIWFAYPKKSSKKYNVKIHRDSGWEIMEKLDIEGVRAVAIDEDWSALRFRRIEYIKSK